LPDPNQEEQRISLYVPGAFLDMAEAQASRLGSGMLHDYCAELLKKAIEAERVREHVAEVEAKRGPMEGLHEIAADPEYLAELSAAAVPRETAGPEPEVSDDSTVPTRFLEAEMEQAQDEERPAELGSASHADDFAPLPPARVEGQGHDRQPRRLSALSPAAEVVLRHAGQSGDDPQAFLPCLRRGAPLAPEEVSELAQALHELETECRLARAMDRRLTFALHRLAFESQILHTDAWPGSFDAWTVDVLRAVQEAVERILSGEDIRYYPDPAQPGPSLAPRPESSP
jgi:hypothetical protein